MKRYYKMVWGRKAREARRRGLANPVRCKSCGEVFDFEKQSERTKHRKHNY